MHLNRLKVESWRAISEAVELADLSPGLNIVYGPNETGKSSLLDAVCRGFFDRHKTASMVAVQPWGTSLGPRVEIDFSVPAGRFRLTKQFVTDQASELRRFHGGAWEKHSTGQTADEAIVLLVNGEHPGRALSKPAHWGLGQVLWCQQGGALGFEIGSAQQDRLREALKLTFDAGHGTAVETIARGWYDAAFTAQGKMKSKGEVAELTAGVAAAADRVAAFTARLAETSRVGHDLGTAEADLDAVSREHAAAQTELDQQRSTLSELEVRLREYDRLAADRDRTKGDWERRSLALRGIDDADSARAAAERESAEASARAEAAAQALETPTEALRQATAGRDVSRRAHKAAEEAAAALDRLVRHVEAVEKRRDAKHRLAQARTVAARVAAAVEELTNLKAPSDGEIKALRRLAREIAEKRVQLDAASLAVRIEPRREIGVAAEIDGKSSATSALSGPLNLSAVGEMVLDLIGVARVTIRAGESDAAELKGQLDALHAKWAVAVALFASSDAGELEALATRRAQAEERLKGLRQQQAEADAVERIAGEVEALEQQVRGIQAEDPSLAARPESADEARRLLVESKAARTRAGEDLERAQERLDEAAESQQRAGDAASDKRRDAIVARELLASRVQEAARRRADDGVPDDARRASLGAALLAMDAARQRLDATPRPPVEEGKREVARLDDAVRSLADQKLDLTGTINGMSVKLQMAGGEGLYSQKVAAAEEHERLGDELSRAKLDADATHLLWSTLQQSKRELLDAVTQPIRRMVTADLELIAGPRYERVDFDEGLAPVGVRPAQRDVVAECEDLSYGTREQLMLLVRLALGRLLSRSGFRQCVILDDPLVNADRGRHRAALRVLEDAARDAQMVVFTCHSAAYEGLAGAKRYDLKALVEASRPRAVEATPAAVP